MDKPAHVGDYDGPIHVVVGNGGQALAGIPPKVKTAKWARYQSDRWGYWQLQVANATHLTMRLLADVNDGASTTNSAPALYSFEIIRHFPRQVTYRMRSSSTYSDRPLIAHHRSTRVSGIPLSQVGSKAPDVTSDFAVLEALMGGTTG
jgi:hypothetical protein